MMKYDYNTGRITRDFHFVKYGEICRLRGVASRVGAQGCQKCPFNSGSCSDIMTYNIDWTSFVKCKHNDAKDSDGCDAVRRDLYDRFEQEALAHMYD